MVTVCHDTFACAILIFGSVAIEAEEGLVSRPVTRTKSVVRESEKAKPLTVLPSVNSNRNNDDSNSNNSIMIAIHLLRSDKK